MTVYYCKPELEALLTCIYEAWSGKKGQENIQLMFEPIDQQELFTEYIQVERNREKAEKVTNAVVTKISLPFFNELAYCSMAYEEDVPDAIYRVMILGFAYGEGALDMVQYRPVMRLKEIRTRLGKEVCRFQEFSRFHEVNGAYIAHIEPKSRIVQALGPIFSDRMPSENWAVIDDIHFEAVVHPKNDNWYIRILTRQELEQILKTEQMNDTYTEMWQIFFKSIAIEERRNPECQRNLFPIWTRKHVVEFFSQPGQFPTT